MTTLERLRKHTHGISLLLSLSALILAGVSMHQASVVTFNKKALVGRFVGQLSTLSLSDEGLREKTAAFSAALTESVNDYAHSHHVLILEDKRVLAGSRDVTAVIARDVSRRMRGHHAH